MQKLVCRGAVGQGMGVRVRIFIFTSQMGVLNSRNRKCFLAPGGMWEECSVRVEEGPWGNLWE